MPGIDVDEVKGPGRELPCRIQRRDPKNPGTLLKAGQALNSSLIEGILFILRAVCHVDVFGPCRLPRVDRIQHFPALVIENVFREFGEL